MWRWWRRRPVRIKVALGVLVSCGLLWPVTAVALVLGLPIFEQTMIALSFLAPVLTSVDILFTAQVHSQRAAGRRRWRPAHVQRPPIGRWRRAGAAALWCVPLRGLRSRPSSRRSPDRAPDRVRD